MKKARLNKYLYDFFVDYNTIDVSDIIDIHEYATKKTVSIASMFKVPDQTKFIS